MKKNKTLMGHPYGKKTGFLKGNRGFTVLELTICVVTIGVLSLIINPMFQMFTSSKRFAYHGSQEWNNSVIASGMLDYTKSSTLLGVLPDPYTGNTYQNAVLDPEDATEDGSNLLYSILQSNINPGLILDDGTESNLVRVYQKVSDITYTMPLYSQAGPLVNLTYDVGVIYQTDCSKQDANCYKAPLPGNSPVINLSNVDSWNTALGDFGPAFMSTLSLQKIKLARTIESINTLKSKILEFKDVKEMQNTGSLANFFPQPGAGLSSDQDPTFNQGCYNGWYDLSSSTIDIVAQLGLSDEYEQTDWGGAVEYCRDYNPTATDMAEAGIAPHYAALRIRKDISAGIDPHQTINGNNIVFTF